MSALQNQFEQFLNDGPVDVFDFLSANPDSSHEEQLAVVLLDQKRRWQSSVPKSVEEYLRQLPHLAMLPNAVVALAVAEFEAQSNTETKPKLQDFTKRFPEVAEQLQEEIEKLYATQSIQANSSHLGMLRDRYRLIRILGEGAFGSVYLALDLELEREVAIKVPTPERFQNSQEGDTYLSEARTVASLVHPHIVPVYDTGKTDEGAVFVVSRFINGETLESRLKQSLPTHERTAQLLMTIAEALAYAHDRRLIHRDVKPANILIEAATNTAFITDFGLAIREEDFTKHLGLAGTLAYMSPEQARGEGHRLDGRSDVFALGIILYEMLTGQRPFRGSTQNEILHQVISVEPRAPRSLRPEIPAELERICSKALSKPLSDRYAKATALAEDLDAWLHPKSSPSLQPTGEERITPKGLRSFDAGDASFFLDLLPGLRNRHGLPESIAFWKQRIEETDSEQTFSVGLIYGPSGCGKSSLVKAGLLPHLSKSVIAIYVEATPDETETRILRALRKQLPELSETLGLADTLTTLRRSESTSPDRKVVIILDQLEQWLHAHRADPDAELVKALRQCDGGRLQAIVMIRDDFAMAAARFMNALDVPILQGENFATVDLFEVDHAAKVLTKFGQAFGKLPANTENLSADEQQFVRDVATGLANEGKVVSVRLALFSEMVKAKPWTPATLQQVGGTQGIGVNFLEETFSSPQANPRHRLHAIAARSVLKSLMPELGTEIKGHMRSHEDLLEATGYQESPKDFSELLRILDGELRLITPTDPEGDGSKSSSSPRPLGPPGERLEVRDSATQYFQLTHDYLVPSLRNWLTRKQRETRKGCAELKLVERSSAWALVHESKQLPSLIEWLNIRMLTDSKDWTEPQRRLMRAAGRVHGLWAAGISMVLLVSIISGIGIRRSVLAERDRIQNANVAQQNETNAKRLVEALVKADTTQVPDIVKQLSDYRKWADPLLKDKLSSAADDSVEKLHLSLATLDQDQQQVDYLYRQLLRTESQRFPVICDALAKHEGPLREPLWKVVNGREPDPKQERLRAAAALAQYDPKSPLWNNLNAEVVNQLATVSPVFLRDWMTAFRPVREKLLAALNVIYRDTKRRESERSLVTEVLADYASDQPEVLAELVKDADETQFAVVFSRLQEHGKAAIPLLESELPRTLTPDWQDPPLSTEWRAVEPLLVTQIEAAKGMIAERFVFCPSMPRDQLPAICEALRPSGYRPIKIRPFKVPITLRRDAVTAPHAEREEYYVAAIWTRDNRKWQLQPAVTKDQLPGPDSPATKDGLVIQDVASLPTTDPKTEPRFIALWCAPSTPNEERRAVIDVSQTELTATQTKLQKQNIVSQTTISVRTDADGQRRYTALFSNLGTPTKLTAAYSGLTLGDEFQRDIAVSAAKKLADPLETFRQQLGQFEKLPSEKLDDPKVREGRATAQYQLGNLDAALADLDFLISKEVSTPKILQYRTLTLARLGKSDEAKESLAKYLATNPPASDQAYVRIQVPAWLGDSAQASTELESSVTALGANSDDRYNVACAAALCSQAFARKDADQSKHFADRAMKLLQQIVAKGSRFIPQMKSDADFAGLHGNPRFSALLAAIEPPAKYATVVSSHTKWESKLLAAVPVESVVEQLKPLLAQGWRPVAIAVDSNVPLTLRREDAPKTAITLRREDNARTAITTERDEYNRTCSLLFHRPVIPNDSQLRLAKRQAVSAIALLRQGEREKIFSTLRVTDDPESLTQFVHRCRARGVSTGELWECVQIVERTRPALRGDGRRLEDRVLFGLLLALGEFSLSDFPEFQRDETVQQLVNWYRDDPSSTIHGAAGWLLRQWQQSGVARKVDETPLAYDPQREWFTLAIPGGDQTFFQTYVVIPPGKYEIGSPGNEPGRNANETRHTVQITRPFALLDREVTRAEFEASAVARINVDQYSPTPQHPMVASSWYDSVRYCRWLTSQAGFSEVDQSCADPKSLDSKVFAADPNTAAGGAPLNWPLRLDKRGFRLPTEAEWEIATRYGTRTPYGFGRDESLFGRYGWFQENSVRQTHLPRTLRPNLLGLFDLHGNVVEWCHDWFGSYGSTSDPLGAARGSYRVYRGGGWDDGAADCRSANRITLVPSFRFGSMGFRLALSPSSESGVKGAEQVGVGTEGAPAEQRPEMP